MKIAIFTGTATAPFMLHLGAALAKRHEVVFVAYNQVAKALVAKNQYRCLTNPNCFSVSPTEDQIKQYSPYYQRDLSVAKNFPLKTYTEKYLTSRCLKVEKWLSSLFAAEVIDGAVFYNGSFYLERIAKKCADQSGISTAFLENGMFPDTAHIDPQGTNGYSEVVNLPPSEWQSISPNDADRFVEECARSLRAWDGSTKSNSATNLHLLKSLSFLEKNKARLKYLLHDVPETAPEIITTILQKISSMLKPRARLKINFQTLLPENFAFLPLQVTNDSQFHAHSDWVKTPQQSIIETYYALKSSRPELRLVVKPHPAELRHVSFNYIVEKYPEIIWVNQIPLDELILKSSLVISVNSSVGFQALLLRKPVICLGRSLYNKLGLAIQATDSPHLSTIITALAGSAQSIDAKFFLWFHKHYCSKYHRSCPTLDEIDEIALKILNLLFPKLPQL